MPLYKRYIDDSNQVAKDTESRLHELGGEVENDKRLAERLKEIADTVMNGIKMETDYPSKNGDSKMPILDMKVWMEGGNILHQHYEKQVASRAVLNAQSAQSAACKRSVHTMEMVRRMLNTSTQLDWEQYVVPILTDYMARMREAGYGERYRKNVLLRAIGIYEKMRKEDEEGVRPLHRPRDWQEEERRSAKKKKRHSWSSKGGYIAPLFVPATPGGELAQMLRKTVEEEAEPGFKFKVLESGGRTIKSQLQKSNPTATPGCDNLDCLACKDGRGKGGSCLKTNIQYELRCQLCPDGDGCVYVGESARNLYTRGREHIEKYRSRKRNIDSFMKKHQDEEHAGLPAEFGAKVTGMFKDCLSRQISEGVSLRRSNERVLNSKSEWHQPPLWRVQNELVRE